MIYRTALQQSKQTPSSIDDFAAQQLALLKTAEAQWPELRSLACRQGKLTVLVASYAAAQSMASRGLNGRSTSIPRASVDSESELVITRFAPVKCTLAPHNKYELDVALQSVQLECTGRFGLTTGINDSGIASSVCSAEPKSYGACLFFCPSCRIQHERAAEQWLCHDDVIVRRPEPGCQAIELASQQLERGLGRGQSAVCIDHRCSMLAFEGSL